MLKTSTQSSSVHVLNWGASFLLSFPNLPGYYHEEPLSQPSGALYRKSLPELNVRCHWVESGCLGYWPRVTAKRQKGLSDQRDRKRKKGKWDAKRKWEKRMGNSKRKKRKAKEKRCKIFLSEKSEKNKQGESRWHEIRTAVNIRDVEKYQLDKMAQWLKIKRVK